MEKWVRNTLFMAIGNLGGSDWRSKATTRPKRWSKASDNWQEDPSNYDDSYLYYQLNFDECCYDQSLTCVL